jgi:hypothetical protein
MSVKPVRHRLASKKPMNLRNIDTTYYLMQYCLFLCISLLL